MFLVWDYDVEDPGLNPHSVMEAHLATLGQYLTHSWPNLPYAVAVMENAGDEK